jgi:acetyltransferase-like isoleucine patch superfamily enzyme
MRILLRYLLEFIDGFIYNISANLADIMPQRFVKILAYYYPDARIRKIYLRKLGLYMGNNTYPNAGLYIAVDSYSEEVKIVIGDNVSIAPNVVFVADSCANNGQLINEFRYVKDKLTIQGKIVVEDEVWIGSGVIILPNITIGRCSIIGAGSVVNRNVEPYSLVAGVPIKKIRDIRD